jgi:hypothetical protein
MSAVVLAEALKDLIPELDRRSDEDRTRKLSFCKSFEMLSNWSLSWPSFWLKSAENLWQFLVWEKNKILEIGK